MIVNDYPFDNKTVKLCNQSQSLMINALFSVLAFKLHPITLHVIYNSFLISFVFHEHDAQVIEKFIRFAYRKRYNGQNMTYEASTFLYAIAVAVFALGGMCGGFVGGWVANKLGR